jgi:hypothetical protein
MNKNVAYILDINKYNTAGLSIAEGFKYAFNANGFNCKLFDIKDFKKSFFFIDRSRKFEQFLPGVVMTSVDMLEYLPLKKMLPTIFFLWGQFYKPSSFEDQIVTISDSTKALLNSFKDRHRFVVWSQHSNEINESYFQGYSSELGLEFIQLIHCADERLFTPPSETNNFDFVWIGNINHRKADYEKYVTPLKQLTTNYKELTDSAGYTSFEVKKKSYSASILSPNVHTKAQRDHQIVLNERVFAATLAGGFQICDINLARTYFAPEEMQIAQNPSEYFEICEHFLKYPDQRIDYILRGQSKILEEHTYSSRVKYLISLINN